MKYRIFGITAAVLMIAAVILCLYIDADEKDVSRYHQHMSARQPDEGCDCDGSELCTHLPILIIDTDGKDIPGVPLTDGRSGEEESFSKAEDGSATIQAQLKVIDNGDSNNHPGDEAAIESMMSIRVRGNSSRYFDKKGYLIGLTDDSGEKNREEPLLGMDEFDKWALHGPYLDKSLIRNYMWYNIAGEMMDYAPNCRFCEVILNGEYQGLYLLVETIDSSADARLRLSEPEDNSEQVSFVLRADRGSSNPIKNVNTFSQNSYRTLMAIDIVYPGTGELTEERINYIEDSFSDFEKSLYSYDYDTGSYKWQEWADFDEIVDYFLINEFTSNYDAGYLSTYFYRDVRGKYKMCIWDFNSACGNYRDDYIDPHHFEMQYVPWFVMLTKDEDFTEGVIARYRELRETYFSDEYICDYVDETVEYLGSAVERNFEVWGYTWDDDMVRPAGRNPENYEEAVQQIKDFCIERGEWMDDNIDNLKQYSHESKVKKYNHDR